MDEYDKKIYDELTAFIKEDSVDIDGLMNSERFEEYLSYIIKNSNLLTNKIVNYCFDNNYILLSINDTESILSGEAAGIDHPASYYFYACPKLFGLCEISDDLIVQYFIEGPFNDYLPYVIKNMKNIDILFDKVPFSSLIWLDLFKQMDDQILIKCFNMPEFNDSKGNIVLAMHDINNKKKYYELLSKNDKSDIVQELKTDELLQLVKPGSNEFINVIRKLSDEEKNMYLANYHSKLKDEELGSIVASFDSIDLMTNNFKYLKSDKLRVQFFVFVNTNLVNNDYFKDIINSIKGEKNIKELVDKLLSMPNYKEDKELILPLLNKIHNPFYLYQLYSSNELMDKEYANNVLSRMGELLVFKYVKENREEMYNYHPLLYIKKGNYLYNTLLLMNIEEQYIDAPYDDDMLPLIDYLSRRNNLNKDHLISLVKIVGFRLLTQLDNENIEKAINLNEEDFGKYIKLMDAENAKIDRSNLSSITDLILNKNFGIDLPDRANIFHNTLQFVAEDSFYASFYITRVFEVVDNNKYKVRKSTDPINDDNKDYLTDDDIEDGIKNGDENIITLYREMCKEYVNKEKNNYVIGKSGEFLNQISVATYDINGVIKSLFKILSKDEIKTFIINKVKDTKNFYSYKSLLRPEILDEIIAFKKNPQYELDPSFKKKYLKQFGTMMKEIVEETNLKYFHTNKACNIPTEFIPKRTQPTTLITIMGDMNIDLLKETVLSNNELYEELLKNISNYKLLGWPEALGNYPENLCVEVLPDVIATYISSYASISKQGKTTVANGDIWTLLDGISEAEARISDSSVYAALFGIDDYRFIRNNRTPNSACMSKSDRLARAVELLKVMHNRSKISVPPINKDYDLSSYKKINVMLGNTNDMINLTYGERTGACMRIGGQGEDLFNFCLENDNGFHISFNDPESGKLISRVSCYRNGNTLFMNELRNPLDKKYTSEDIQEAARLIAKDIIELTKDSKYPIQNVIAADAYAFGGCGENVNITPKKGISSRLYTDIKNDHAVIVATAGDGLTPLVYDENKVEKYDVGRAPIRKHERKTAGNAVVHIEVLDAFYDDVPIDQIEYEAKDVEIAYTGEDWYVGITKEGNIISYVQRNSRNPEIANKEMAKYELIIRQVLESKKIEESPEISGKGRAV